MGKLHSRFQLTLSGEEKKSKPAAKKAEAKKTATKEQG
jgi:hypothetical protein|tara:strand:- start:859 stop:972 length:114 start_codon:yes stop_codon:yes gene_type:complete